MRKRLLLNARSGLQIFPLPDAKHPLGLRLRFGLALLVLAAPLALPAQYSGTDGAGNPANPSNPNGSNGSNGSMNPHGLDGSRDRDGPSVNPQLQEQMAQRRNSERQKELVADTEKLFQLAQQLRDEVAKSNKDQLAVPVVKKSEEIEKLAKSVKEKMRGY